MTLKRMTPEEYFSEFVFTKKKEEYAPVPPKLGPAIKYYPVVIREKFDKTLLTIALVGLILIALVLALKK